MTEARDVHRYEDHAKIYLYFQDHRWHLDPVTIDGYSLDGLHNGPECTYGHRCPICKTPAAIRELEEVEQVALPDADEVLHMLADGLGYYLSQQSGDGPRIELVVYRDPDGDTEMDLYIDGQHRHAEEYHVDPSRGTDAASWHETRREHLASASPAAQVRLREIYEIARPTLHDPGDV